MKILIVDDTRAIAVLMSARLSSLGHEVSVAGNGEEGLKMFMADTPDLVFMDIEMPVMNGFEATSRIRSYESAQSWAWTPIIFLTASDTADNLVTAIEAGGDDFMSKSVPEPVLQAKMKAMSRIAALRERLSTANRMLENLASKDGLTGLPNRRHLDLMTDAAWADVLRDGKSFALLMLDVDNFKKYNDHYGHHAGDQCLRGVAAAIGRAVVATNAEGTTAGALAARYGGEEFAVVIPDADEAAYELVAGKVLEGVRQLRVPHEKNAAWGIVTVSIGGARISPASGTLGELFRLADTRLYQAKEAGRNRSQLA